MCPKVIADGLGHSLHLYTDLQSTSLCPRFQSGHLTAENEIKPFLKPMPGQVGYPWLGRIKGVVTLVLLWTLHDLGFFRIIDAEE